MNEKFKNKYLKYKNKYLHFKKKKFKGGYNKTVGFAVTLFTTIVVLAGLTAMTINSKDSIMSNIDMFTRKAKKQVLTRTETEQIKNKKKEEEQEEEREYEKNEKKKTKYNNN